MKVKEYNFPTCKVTIHSDYMVGEEEKAKILERIGKIVSNTLEEKLQKDKTA